MLNSASAYQTPVSGHSQISVLSKSFHSSSSGAPLFRILTKRERLKSAPYLTLSWPGKFLFHPKIGCFNFKPQYLLNYSSPKNDLYSVRKRSTRAFKSIFKLLGWGLASAGPLRAKFLREVLRWRAASPYWLRTLRQNFARVVSLLAFNMFQNILRPL